MVRITADTAVCVGAGQCVLTEPTVFDQDDDGIVLVSNDHPDGDTADRARDAVTLCPSRALSIAD